ncbi:hypothetical protein OG871_28270 [Kitasatospora sp. NBC_00374]|uniref:hypothetical protein n=1 Tax=Kitasatospora sp. NBC_00374 TaxID=2975964 RepID=UPI003251C92F
MTADTDPLSGVTAGPYTDPLTGEHHLLIQQPGPALLTDSARLAQARAALHTQCPQTRSTLLRTPPDTTLPAPWRRRLTYLRCADPADLPDPEHTLEVVPAAADDDTLVLTWLTRALMRGAADIGHAVPASAAGSIAESVCAQPGRVSLVARRAGRTIGHATLLTGRDDDVTGEPITELVDVLVEDGEDVALTTAVLCRAAAAHAQTLGQALVGNVVHGHDQDPATGGRDTWRIVTALLARGWRIDHEFWWAPAPTAKEAP